MIFDNAIEQARAAASKAQPVIKLADVASVSNGKALVTFYGETVASTKYFSYIVGYKPTVGDKVALLAVGNSYIILGKVSTDSITNNYYPTAAEVESTYESQTHASNTYLSKTDASNTYLSKTDANSDYLKKTDASNTYLSKTDASNTYLSKTDANSDYLKKTDASNTYLSKTDASNTYLSKTDANSDYLKKTDAASTYMSQSTGDSRYRGINTPFDEIKSGTKSFKINSSGEIAGSGIQIGTTNSALDNINTNILRTDYIRYKGATSTTSGMQLTSTDLYPVTNGGYNLGTAIRQFQNVRAINVYVNGSPVSGSDKRKKKNIKDLARKYIKMFFRLCPVTYKYKNGQSNRTHAGFIAQEVEQAAKDEGIELEDLAAVCIDEDGTYGLRYEEFVPILTAVVQEQQKQIEDLTARIHGLECVVYK